MNNEIDSTSPNGRHKARLYYKGEIRFGPAYFRLELDGKILSFRLFGEILCWSPDSRYLAAQEWLTTDEQVGPHTRVLLIDSEKNRYSEFEVVENGFAENFQFVGDTFVYRKHYYGNDQVTDAEVDVTRIMNWKKIGVLTGAWSRIREDVAISWRTTLKSFGSVLRRR